MRCSHFSSTESVSTTRAPLPLSAWMERKLISLTAPIFLPASHTSVPFMTPRASLLALYSVTFAPRSAPMRANISTASAAPTTQASAISPGMSCFQPLRRGAMILHQEVRQGVDHVLTSDATGRGALTGQARPYECRRKEGDPKTALDFECARRDSNPRPSA